MAEDLGVSSFVGSFTSAGSTAATVINWAVIIAVFGVVLFLVWFILQYKHQAKIKVWTNNGYYYMNDKAREVTKDGVTQWHLWGLRVYASTPPPGSRSLAKRGKQVAEGYYTPDTGVIWATDKTTRELIQQKFKKKEDGTTEQQDMEMERDAELFTTTERAMMIDQIKRAMMRKRKNALEVIGQLAAPVALVIILLLVLIFWGDIAQPVQALQQSNAEISEQNAQISTQNANILGMLTGKKGLINVTQNIPGDAQ